MEKQKQENQRISPGILMSKRQEYQKMRTEKMEKKLIEICQKISQNLRTHFQVKGLTIKRKKILKPSGRWGHHTSQ